MFLVIDLKKLSESLHFYMFYKSKHLLFDYSVKKYSNKYFNNFDVISRIFSNTFKSNKLTTC
jgi:hypothetical protein